MVGNSSERAGAAAPSLLAARAAAAADAGDHYGGRIGAPAQFRAQSTLFLRFFGLCPILAGSGVRARRSAVFAGAAGDSAGARNGALSGGALLSGERDAPVFPSRADADRNRRRG